MDANYVMIDKFTYVVEAAIEVSLFDLKSGGSQDVRPKHYGVTVSLPRLGKKRYFKLFELKGVSGICSLFCKVIINGFELEQRYMDGGSGWDLTPENPARDTHHAGEPRINFGSIRDLQERGPRYRAKASERSIRLTWEHANDVIDYIERRLKKLTKGKDGKSSYRKQRHMFSVRPFEAEFPCDKTFDARRAASRMPKIGGIPAACYDVARDDIIYAHMESHFGSVTRKNYINKQREAGLSVTETRDGKAAILFGESPVGGLKTYTKEHDRNTEQCLVRAEPVIDNFPKFLGCKVNELRCRHFDSWHDILGRSMQQAYREYAAPLLDAIHLDLSQDDIDRAFFDLLMEKLAKNGHRIWKFYLEHNRCLDGLSTLLRPEVLNGFVKAKILSHISRGQYAVGPAVYALVGKASGKK